MLYGPQNYSFWKEKCKAMVSPENRAMFYWKVSTREDFQRFLKYSKTGSFFPNTIIQAFCQTFATTVNTRV